MSNMKATEKKALYQEAFAILKRAQELLLAARAKHEAQIQDVKKAA